MIRHSNKAGNGLILTLAVLVFSLATGVFLKYISQPAFASEPTLEPTTDVHFVSIFDGSNKTTIKTSADTVKLALEQAGIEYTEFDNVEPAVTELITTKQYFINIYRAHPAVVVDGDTTRKVMTASIDPRQIAENAGFVLHEQDTVSVAPVTADLLLESGTTGVYEINRSKIVDFYLYGKLIFIHTNVDTVGEFIEEQGITIIDGDTLSAKLDAPIVNGMQLTLNHDRQDVIIVDEIVQYEVRTIYDYNRDKGYSAVQSAGENGEKTVTYEVKISNGVETSRVKLSEIITKQPIEEVRVVGARVYLPEGSHQDWMRAAGIAESDFGYVEFIISKESGWGHTKWNKAGSGAYGLCQAKPATKMATAGSDWETNPITQLKWCHSYAISRYGSWQNAYNFWVAKRWW